MAGDGVDVVSVRRATEDDADAVAELHRVLHEPHVRAMPQEYPPYDRAATLEYYRGILADPSWLVWVAEAGGRPVGFLGAAVQQRPESPFTLGLRVLYVHQLAVADDARGRGVGRALLAAAEQAAPALGCTEVRLDHRAFNEGAHRFYASLGYTTHLVGMRKATGGAPDDRSVRRSVDPAAGPPTGGPRAPAGPGAAAAPRSRTGPPPAPRSAGGHG